MYQIVFLCDPETVNQLFRCEIRRVNRVLLLVERLLDVNLIDHFLTIPSEGLHNCRFGVELGGVELSDGFRLILDMK